MEQELFNKYFLDTKRWVKKSRELMISAHYLVFIGECLYNTGRDTINRYHSVLQCHPFEAWHSVGSSASLLMGFALENALKAHLIEKGIIYINEQNKIIGLDRGHNLLSMLEESNYKMNEEEKETIRLLTFQLQSLSRYHLARSPRKQAEFTGRVGNPAIYYNLITKIILEILSAENRELYLKSDGSYEHIPQTPNFSRVPIAELLRQQKNND